jgi:hypothetical protein
MVHTVGIRTGPTVTEKLPALAKQAVFAPSLFWQHQGFCYFPPTSIATMAGKGKNMRLGFFIILAGVLLTLPRLSEAQEYGGSQSDHKAKSSTMKASMGMMQGNMALMAEITDKMQQMMSTERMSPEQQSQILNMMRQMSHMMREMAVPHGEQVKKRHNHELQETRKKLDSW